jgi:hypothetical protein
MAPLVSERSRGKIISPHRVDREPPFSTHPIGKRKFLHAKKLLSSFVPLLADFRQKNNPSRTNNAQSGTNDRI